VASVDDHAKYLRSKPTDMPNKQPTTNSSMPDRLYGEHYPDAFLDVSRPVRESNVATLGDYIRYLQEIGKQPDQPCFACEPSKSSESTYDHICPNNPILTCNCADPKYCAELGNDPDRQYRDAPDADKDGNEDRCPDHDSFSDNLDYTGIPIPTRPNGKSAISDWPCVVVGAFCETWTTASERVLRTTASEWATKQHTDAGLNNDGPTATTKL
jgi:hypothetical protein